MEIWILQIWENPERAREIVIEEMLKFLKKEGVEAKVLALIPM